MNMTEFNVWLDKYLNFEKRPEKNIFWLNTMEYLCKLFGNPENSVPCFHVAGSKGKGSVSMMIASILEEHNLKTGIYSSPHILDMKERMATVNGFFPEKIYSDAADEIVAKINSLDTKNLPGERPLTWFEIVTLFAMICFKKAKCNCSVYEVGLGGRLDATNVIHPKVSCISRIELEHTEYLGDTVEKIATEKGGIIKENTPVIISSQEQSVKEVFKKNAEEKNSPVYFIDEIVDLKTELIDSLQHLEINSKFFKRPIKTNLKMIGDFQAENAALAAVAVKLVYPEISEDEIEKGLSKAFLQARFEITETPWKKTLILDGAHTVKSIQFTMNTFNKLYAGKKRYLLFACAADKEAEQISKSFKNQFDSIILTRPGETKTSDLQRLSHAFTSQEIDAELIPDYKTAIKKFLNLTKNEEGILLVTGSFYLVSEVKKILAELS